MSGPISLQTEHISEGDLFSRLESIANHKFTMIRPGAPFRIHSMTLPFDLPFKPPSGTYRSVVEVTCRSIEKGKNVGETLTVAVLVPERMENVECSLVLLPGYAYMFEVQGNPVHFSAKFLNHGEDSKQIPKTVIRHVALPNLKKSDTVATVESVKMGTDAGEAEDEWAFE
ncbi:hypothetical protein CVT24_005863 [Panaeolus cyanescens]|uniref:Uncharacterized protein n=1 Tax=Panaeolus cyanescens TaxID=181874 RepID=A0A409YEZ3_9AGAR|nr:hypothetical protein CVT24_005863 [Panaeolus cyanescens]